MDWKVVGLLATAALSGCAQPSAAVKVSNQSTSPVAVTYTEKGTGASQTLRVAAGEVRSLGSLGRLTDYERVEFRTADKSAVFSDESPAGWRDSGCTGHCRFVWYGNGRVAITT